ncbi:LacI family DNA-binding transcriptional regulator [Consotaella aegiceratis]|uniref:LacI family DNA-binding transcriptional regulator n=1 Tax=Consotaella aegiceratis TaxID=3097961 RepID=UPI002F3ECBB5
MTSTTNLPPRPSQADVARQAGVSTSTVSRVLSDAPGISDVVRKQVRAAAEQMGYRIRRSGRIMGGRALALVPLDRSVGGLSSHYDDIVTGLRTMAVSRGMAVEVRLVRYASIGAAALDRHVRDARADGAMLVGVDPTEDVRIWARDERRPVVLVNGCDPNLQFSGVAPTNFWGGYTAATRLLEAGHRHLVHFKKGNRSTIRQRANGFETAVAAWPGATGLVEELPSVDILDNEQHMDRILVENPAVTAAFCMNDLMAVSLLHQLDLRGRRVPDDFAVIGFDDLPCAGMASPRLTTMRVERRQLGGCAVDLFLAHLQDPTLIPRQVELTVHLVEGGTAPLS